MVSLYQEGKYIEALPIARQLLEMSKKENGPESTETISMMRYVAQMDMALGKEDEAETLLLEAELLLAKAPTSTPQYARTLGDLAKLYNDRKLDFVKAELYLKRSIAIFEKIGAPDSLDLGTAMNNLGDLYARQGRLQEALEVEARIVEIREKSLSTVDPGLAHSLIARGRVYSDLGKYEKSEMDLKRALAILQTVKGSDHRDVAQALGVMAQNELEMGRLDESRDHWREALTISEQVDGPNSLHVAYILGGLAAIDAKRGEYDKAQAGFQRVIAMLEAGWGPDDPRIAWQLKGLGEMYLDEGNLDRAEVTLQRAASILQKRYGPNTIYVSPVLLDLAIVERKKKGYAKAMAYASQALAIDDQLTEPAYWLISRELVQITFLNLDQGNCAGADSTSTRALETEQPHELDDPKGFREALLARSKTLGCLGRAEEAAQLLERINSIQP